MGTYDLPGGEDRMNVLHRREEAFETLIGEEKGEAYEQSISSPHVLDGPLSEETEARRPAQRISLEYLREREEFLNEVKGRIQQKNVKMYSEEILAKGEVSGSDLRRLREHGGLQLQEVFEVTRVNVPILNAIENDEPGRLPARTYLKGFLRSYAELLQIDPKRVVDGYLEHMERSQSAR